MNRILVCMMSVAVLLAASSVLAQKPSTPIPAPTPAPAVAPDTKPAADIQDKVEIKRLNVRGTIDGANITFTLEFDAEVKEAGSEVPLIVGQVTLAEMVQPKSGYKLRYDTTTNTYYMGWRDKGTHHVKASFAARAQPVATKDARPPQSQPAVVASPWLEAVFSLPAAQVRQLDVTCDRTDLEVQFPDAMRLDRNQKDGKLILTAILGPGKPFIVRFKPQVQKMEAKLVYSSLANIITTVSAATMRVDSLFTFDVAQGTLSEIQFKLPPSLSITQVRGQFIQDWSLVQNGGERILKVSLNRPQDKQYVLQVQGEGAVPPFPSSLSVPVIEPLGVLRASGHLAVGTDSAIQLQVAKTAGLTQIDTKAFLPALLDAEHPRPLPVNKVFSYTFATLPYELALRLDNITPTYDALYRQTVTVKDEDFTIDTEITLDVREAPLRDLLIECPTGFQVAAVTGALVDDYRLDASPRASDKMSATRAASRPSTRQAQANRVHIQFKQPVLGKTNIALRLELGRGPLDELQTVEAIRVIGAKTERGFLAVAAEDGIQIEELNPTNLRDVNVASLEVIPPDARLAYRFRQSDWSLSLKPHKKPASIRTESFHLVSLGEGKAYGSVAISYFITGSPVSKLQFTMSESLRNVQFVGRDVRRYVQDEKDPTKWTVYLQRSVVGDYNLGLMYDLPYETDGEILAGAVQCADGETTQTGYIIVTSHLNLELEQVASGKTDKAILEISREEVPGNYRLLANAPILKTFKYDRAPHAVAMTVKTHARAEVIPAIVEVMDAATRLAVHADNNTESVTTIRYKVKNTSCQFLTLQMPKDATVWSARLIERSEDGQESATRLAASVDAKLGLMIPLPRYRNPNDPITIELEYGQTHEKPGLWTSTVSLAAPKSVIPATFAHWRITVPADYAVRAGAGANMVPSQSAVQQHNIASVLQNVGNAWAWTFASGISPIGTLLLVAAIAIFLVVLAFIWRRAVPDAAVGLCAFLLLIVGIMATRAPTFQRDLASADQATSIQFTQIVNLQEQNGLNVVVVSVPAWRQHLTLTTAVAVPAVLLGLALLAIFARRLRKLCLVAAIAMLAMGAAAISPLVVPLGHLFTWGLPLAMVIAFAACRLLPLLGRLRVKPTVAAILLLGLLSAAPGCAGGLGSTYISDDPVIDRIDYKLSVEKDSMVIDCSLKVSAPRPADFVLIGQSAVLLSQAQPQKNVSIELSNGMHHLKIKEPGIYEIKAQFLHPLDAPDAGRVSSFSMPMPLALSNSVELTVPEADIEIVAPTAFRCSQDDGGPTPASSPAASRPSAGAQKTVAHAIMPPGGPMWFIWKPRARQPQREETKFYSQVTSVVCFDASLVSVIHDIRLQVAQGELKQVRIAIPVNTVVTAVNGTNIGAWRFDPGAKELEVRFASPVTGDYSMQLVAQAAVASLPYDFEVRPIAIAQTQRQRTLVGLVHTGEVFIDAAGKAQAINMDDFARDAATLIKQTPAAQVTPAFAYRLEGDAVSVRVGAVSPELRINETAAFNVMDERLTYNGKMDIQITKAGVFAIQLAVPAAYDVDALTAPQISHWDDIIEDDSALTGTTSSQPADGQRIITVHFKQKTLGPVQLSLAMSRPISQLPPKIAVPRVELIGAIRHTGQAILRADRGVRLSVDDRQGVTEVNPLELGVRETGTLAFKLLKPTWSIRLQAEAIEPLINVDTLHVARISEGLVQHQLYLQYRPFHAGVKILKLQLPPGALGVTLTGADIARRQEIEPGKWQIELAKKIFEVPYQLQVTYQTQFDRQGGMVPILPVQAVGADQQRGHVVVYTTDRVELRPEKVDQSLQPAEARTVPGRMFGAGDLSDAAFCYANSAPNYSLTLRAIRHDEAKQIEADVDAADFRTVVTESGQSINYVHLSMTVGSKRYLRCWLPQGAQIWSLLVNGRAAAPSKETDGGREVLLIPLAQAASRNIDVQVDLVYVLPDKLSSWKGRRNFSGPRFDLPLKNIRWTFFLPESFEYEDFKGAMAVQEETSKHPTVLNYNMAKYEQSVNKFNISRNRKALEYQDVAKRLAQEGKQYGAREMLEQARTYSLSDTALNEDINVDLGNLLRQQAKVGLVGSRDRLRRQTPGAANQSAGELGDQFNQQQAEQIESGLSQADNENLDLISRRMIATQDAAAGNRVQLLVELPQRGRVLEFTRPLLVEPDSPLELSFDAEQPITQRLPRSWLWTLGLFLGLGGLLYAGTIGGRGIRRLRERLNQPAPTTPSDEERVSASDLGIETPEKPEQ